MQVYGGVICYCQPTKCTVWAFVCAHFPSGADVARVLPFIRELNAALRSLENKFKKQKVDMFCGADENVQFNMVEDDAGNLGPVQVNSIHST